ncbi:hypothetical protein GCM10008967_02330 [Bacillus carboniphilus]|uniref:Radical SAM core domain-containing protein n=1 Tax=Bacillus carboniphilus TaxID=86663 RepID=A0ABP3FHP2_9BACI
MDIQYKSPQKILTPTGGFLTGYSHSLNPYVGCAFGCSYCYVRQSPVGLFRKQEWGTWVDVKENVKDKLIRELQSLKKRNKKTTIFMSSSTDPYQSLDYKEQITRGLLEAMVESPPDFLFVQTRSPLVTRDTDLFLQLKDRLRISVTVETDLDEVRKRFSPAAPPIQARFNALCKLKEAGLPSQVAVTPVLPFSNEFPYKLKEVVNRICIDDFTGDGSQGKRTERLQIKELYDVDELNKWYSPDSKQRVLNEMKKTFTPENIYIGAEGFMPY